MKIFNFNLFKNRTVNFWIGFGSGVLWLVATFVYMIYSIAVGLLSAPILIVMILGIAASAFVVLTDLKFMPIIPSVLFVLAFGLFIDNRVEMFAYMATGVYGISGETTAILEVVVTILAMMAVSVIASIISSFGSNRKEENK